jgi:hypothetical protein
MTASITAYSAISCPSSCDQSLRRTSVIFAPLHDFNSIPRSASRGRAKGDLRLMLSETVLATHGQPIGNLSLPNMVTAAARYGFGRLSLGQLLLADGARFSQYVDHGLTPRLNQSMTEAGSEFIVSPGT